VWVPRINFIFQRGHPKRCRKNYRKQGPGNAHPPARARTQAQTSHTHLPANVHVHRRVRSLRKARKKRIAKPLPGRTKHAQEHGDKGYPRFGRIVAKGSHKYTSRAPRKIIETTCKYPANVFNTFSNALGAPVGQIRETALPYLHGALAARSPKITMPANPSAGEHPNEAERPALASQGVASVRQTCDICCPPGNL
jgi:hypothetical protein